MREGEGAGGKSRRTQMEHNPYTDRINIHIYIPQWSDTQIKILESPTKNVESAWFLTKHDFQPITVGEMTRNLILLEIFFYINFVNKGGEKKNWVIK